ncbi:MAG: hypothetical protein K0S44_464 [Bacteroidetes bacterium]|jgi:hypothetical protein|nr:hypothetical protein [Bacteroidota bacterium]
MKNKFLFAFTICCIQFSYAQTTVFDWVKQLNGICITNAITTDKNGNQYIIGQFRDTVDFDPGTGIYNMISDMYLDMFILKLDASGSFVWSKQIKSSKRIYGNAICLDSQGDIYATGYCEDTTDFDPGTPVYNLITDYYYENAFVLKLDPAGDFMWASLLGDGSYSYGSSISVDPFGNVLTTGYFSGTADFDPGADTFNLVAYAGSFDAYISKLDMAGNLSWVRKIGHSGADYGTSVNADSTGNIYISGSFQNTVDFDPSPVIYHMSSAGSADAFILKLDLQGNFLWSHRFGSYENDYCNDVSLDGNCNIYICGTFKGTSDFNPNAGVYNMTSSGSTTQDIFIIKIDSLSNFIWAKQMGGISNEYPCSIFLDALNNIYTTGYFLATSDFDPGPATMNLTSSGSQDIFISKLDNSGNYLWAKQIGAGGSDYSYSIAVDPAYNIYTTGRFQSQVDFDPNSGVYNLTGMPGSSFIHKLNQLSVGINEEKTTVDLTIYPNPGSGFLTIETGKDAIISITDIMSKKILEYVVKETITLDLSFLTTGIYFIRELNSGQIQKFIKQ